MKKIMMITALLLFPAVIHGMEVISADEQQLTEVLSVNFNPHESHHHKLACGCKDGTIRIYDTSSGKILRTMQGHESSLKWREEPEGYSFNRGEEHWPKVHCVRYSPHDPDELSSCGIDMTIRTWNPNTGEQTDLMDNLEEPFGLDYRFMDGIRYLAYLPDLINKKILLIHNNSRYIAYDIEKHTYIHRSGYQYPVGNIVSFNPYTKRVDFGWQNPKRNEIAYIDCSTHDEFHDTYRGFHDDPKSPYNVNLREPNHGKPTEPNGVDFLWPNDTSKYLSTLHHFSKVISLVYHPDGNELACGLEDGDIVFWDTRSPEKSSATLEAHDGSVNELSYNASGKILVSGSSDGTIKLWDAIQKRLLKTIKVSSQGKPSYVTQNCTIT